MRDMDARQRNDLDRHITGNYGEDQYPDESEEIEEIDPMDAYLARCEVSRTAKLAEADLAIEAAKDALEAAMATVERAQERRYQAEAAYHQAKAARADIALHAYND